MSPNSPRPLSARERVDWLRLIRSENVGPATFFALLRHFGDIAAAIENAPDLSRRGGRKRAIRIASRADAEAEIEALTAIDGRLIACGEPEYPAALAAIHDPPPVIQMLGHARLLAGPCIAIVGARNASLAGRQFARATAAELADAGMVVVSGMARGIDTASHDGAMAGGTVAVLAGGVDNIYPPENEELYRQLKAEGAIISEQKLGTRPMARHFPPRNRLISGLSLGVLVVEAALRSGSLITARMALEQGREVFAVPGSPLDPRHKGTNRLLRDGALLTESARDIMDNLAGMTEPPLSEPETPTMGPQPIDMPSEKELSTGRGLIVELLSPTPVSIDELLRECQLSPAVVLTALLELELAGRLERLPGNRVSLIS
jgi:DNA processing protein